jgi:hypothetical protein
MGIDLKQPFDHPTVTAGDRGQHRNDGQPIEPRTELPLPDERRQGTAHLLNRLDLIPVEARFDLSQIGDGIWVDQKAPRSGELPTARHGVGRTKTGTGRHAHFSSMEGMNLRPSQLLQLGSTDTF